jgi:putative metalloprotease
MIDFSGQNALRTALAMVLSRFLPGIGVWIANGVATLLAARLSRSDEYEADGYAAALLTKAGIGIGPQKAMFEKLEKLTEARAGVLPAWLMSHPKTSDRIAALERLEARWARLGAPT